MILAQLSGTERTPYRNAINIATVRAKVNLVAPYLVTVNVRVNVPRYAMGIIHIDPTEILQLDKRLKYRAFLQEWAHIVKPLFAVVKADVNVKSLFGTTPVILFLPLAKYSAVLRSNPLER